MKQQTRAKREMDGDSLPPLERTSFSSLAVKREADK
jgi:hypothetical protein